MMEALVCHPLGNFHSLKFTVTQNSDMSSRYHQGPHAALAQSSRPRCKSQMLVHDQISF